MPRQTRREYIPVGSDAASLRHTVCRDMSGRPPLVQIV
jgi:hypothetical protein